MLDDSQLDDNPHAPHKEQSGLRIYGAGHGCGEFVDASDVDGPGTRQALGSEIHRVERFILSALPFKLLLY
ncbi:MAG: hypothetical protein ABL931_03415 [Usitatibacteraceae bacterium]